MRKKRYTWKFENMHKSLQILSIFIGGLAFVGWSMIGMWFLYYLMMG